jgi:membrane protease YdiL (CAAX protease family)
MNTIKRAHIFMLSLMLYALIAPLIIRFILSTSEIELNFTATALISQYLIILLPVIIYFLITKASIVETLHFKKVSINNIGLAIGIGFFIQPTMNFINIISQFFVKNYIGELQEEMMAIPYLLLIFLMAITPAIVEEVTFRGIILRNYQSQTVLAACLVNGLLFGIFHGNINQFLYAFLLGAVFCYIVHLTGSIIPAMLIHFIINASSITLVVIANIIDKYLVTSDQIIPEISTAVTDTNLLVVTAVIMFLLMLFTLPITLFFIYRMQKHNNTGNLLKNGAISGVVLGDIITEADTDTDDSPIKTTIKEPIFTPIFILIIVYFILYIALFEFILP